MTASEIQSKMCSSCKELLPIAAFDVAPTYRDGRRGQCRACRSAYTMAYRERTGWKPGPRRTPQNPATERAARMRRKYGISVEGYEDLLRVQEGKCAICDREESIGRRLAVDHCHTTKRVRGLLCYKCNTALGLFEDDLNALKNAADYLRRSAFQGGPAMADTRLEK